MKKIIATVVSLKGDNRVYAQTKVGGVEITALLDSGATSNCIGKAYKELLNGREDQITKIFDENVRTADGGKHQ